jgi:hypothetical protein
MFSIIFFIIYFDYILSIVELLSSLCICSYNTHPNVHGVGGRDHVSMVFRWYLPVNILYIPGHVVDHGCDIPVESYVVYSLNIDQVGRGYIEGRG